MLNKHSSSLTKEGGSDILGMLRFLMVEVRLLRLSLSKLVLCVTLLSQSAYADQGQVSPSSTGSICRLTQSVVLYLGHEGEASVATLEGGASLTLKVEHLKRWLVRTGDGKLGFILKDRLATHLACTQGQTSPETKNPTGQVTPALDAADIAEVAEALEVTKAKATGIDIPEEVIAEQASKVARAAESRDAARREEGTLERGLIRVAVYDFELINVARNLGSATTEALLQEVRKLEGVSAIGMDEIREMLDFEAQRQAMGLGCEADDACFAEIAGALGVDEIITGKLTEQADGRMMVLKRIDQRRAEVLTSHTERLSMGSGEEFLLAVGPAMGKLYPKRDYRPGTTQGVPERLVLRLNPPPVPRLVTEITGWSALGAFLAGGVSLAGAYFQNESYQSDLVGSRREAMSGSDIAQAQSLGEGFERASYGFFVTSATLAAVYGALYAITDWEGYGEAHDHDEEHDHHEP